MLAIESTLPRAVGRRRPAKIAQSLRKAQILPLDVRSRGAAHSNPRHHQGAGRRQLAEKTPALLLLPVEPFRHCEYGEPTVLWIGAWNSKWPTFGISRRHARRPVLLSQKPEYLWVCFSAALVGGGAHRAKLVRRHLKGHLAGV